MRQRSIKSLGDQPHVVDQRPQGVVAFLARPSPNTVWVAFRHNSQPRQPCAALRSAETAAAP
jgi:hypothetical protein